MPASPVAAQTQLSAIVTPVVAFGCLFANFTLTYVSSYALNGSFLALAGCAALVLMVAGRVARWPLFATAALVAVVAAKALGTQNLEESVKSGAQIVFAALCLCILGVRHGTVVHHERFCRLLGTLMSIHALLLIAQALTLNLVGSSVLLNPFGRFSPIGPAGALDMLPGPYLPYDDGVMRPNGFYSEPSVAAAYTVFALACVLSAGTIGRWRKTVMAMVLTAGAFATFALTGWVMLGGVWGCYLLFGTRNMKRVRKLSLYGVAALALIAAMVVGGAYLLDRAGGAGEFGGSIYIRFTGPFILMADVLQNGIIGLPINDPTFLLTRDYLVDFAGRQFFTLDNFYVWLIVYFGLPGMLLIAWCLARLVPALRTKGVLALPLVVLALFAAATGSGYNSVFVLPLAIGLAIVRVKSSPVAALSVVDGFLPVNRLAFG